MRKIVFPITMTVLWGTVFTSAMHNLTLGICMGIMMGIVLIGAGASLSSAAAVQKKKNDDSQNQKTK